MQAFLSEFRWCQPDSAIIKFSSSVFFPVILLSISDLCPRSIILSSWKMEIWGFFFHFFIKNFPWSTVWLPRICVLSCFSRVRLCATTWTITRQIPLSMGLSRQEYWSGLAFPPSGDLLDPGVEPATLSSPALAGGFLTTSATWETPIHIYIPVLSICPSIIYQTHTLYSHMFWSTHLILFYFIKKHAELLKLIS